MSIHVIVGAGPVGSGTARRLADDGHDVRIVTRSGSGPVHDRIELVAADAANQQRLGELTAGAAALYNCANPPYHRWASDWPPLAASLIGAAESAGARLVTTGNLYSYAADSSPMLATDPLRPPSRKGAIRATMSNDAFAAHDAGRIRATEVRASDFFGPGLGQSAHLGERMIPKLLAGENVSVIGRPDVVHSWTYIGDVTRALATLGNDDRALGRAWHVPTVAPLTVEQMVARICAEIGVETVKVRRIPTVVLRLAGLFMPMMRELPEMAYQFERPFVIDASETADVFGLEPTPLAEQITETVTSYRSRTVEPVA